MRVFILIILSIVSSSAFADRIKDIASVGGVRDNQLIGYGLVVGLDGSGDQTQQTPFTVQSLKSMLAQFGITLPPNVSPQLKNVAAVSVHASLPAFAKPGQNIDVTVASIGNAKSLRGGSLLMTPLKAVDGNIYALAQGNLVVSGFGAAQDGSRVTVNIPSTGRIPNGAVVERAVPSGFAAGNTVELNLHTSDFTTASRLAQAINNRLGEGTAHPMDGSSIQVAAPRNVSQRVAFISELENLEVDPARAPARIIINSRTGTVVIGSGVKVSPAAVSHGNLTVRITARPEVSQPNPLAQGQTVVVPNTDIQIEQENNRMFLFSPGVSLDEIVRAVNEVGAAPGDLVAILEALKEAGALKAELLVI
ncbi:MAG: flagellar basal body P-ring protein FlgI [Gammaproteobacteria bacterium]|nr:flagellar basal body P-ring protein FlgI [Gammaproteobacteria bacterium]MDH5728285.1 flagellar basal body P-ring protein FlgI [Gammaproteobacteria bacterium]